MAVLPQPFLLLGSGGLLGTQSPVLHPSVTEPDLLERGPGKLEFKQ